MLLQAYDYVALYDRFGCVLQMGGSDQWGNIITGIDLIRRMRGGQAHALVAPLITDSSGNKFGKTVDGAVWLDPEKTSPYQFYQYWLNAADEDAGKLLRCFTLLGQEEIAELEERLAARPERREAQRRLADEVTRMTHGDEALRTAQAATEALFGGDVSSLGADVLLDVFHDVPSSEIPRERLEGDGVQLTGTADADRTGRVSRRGAAAHPGQRHRAGQQPRERPAPGSAPGGRGRTAAWLCCAEGRGSGGWCGWWGSGSTHQTLGDHILGLCLIRSEPTCGHGLGPSLSEGVDHPQAIVSLFSAHVLGEDSVAAGHHRGGQDCGAPVR